ncbi:MAG: class I SAM-dependent methyltransferase [Myxococcota bacterium]
MKEEQASATAFLVQQGLLYSATRWTTAHLVSDESRDASIRLLSRLPEGQRYLRQLDSPARLQIALKERLLLPGACLHYALRKGWLESKVRAAVAGGARQVINLGAGFDTLILRLAAEDPQLRLIEVDHPATLAAKTEALATEPHADRVELLAVDFTRESLESRLPTAKSFAPAEPTVIIIEGVLPYLNEEETRQLFRSLNGLFEGPLDVVFTFLGESSPTGTQPYGPLLRAFLAVKKETVRLRCDPPALKVLLSEEGFRLNEFAMGPDLLREAGDLRYDGPVHDLEMLAHAQRTS